MASGSEIEEKHGAEGGPTLRSQIELAYFNPSPTRLTMSGFCFEGGGPRAMANKPINKSPKVKS